MNISTTIRNLMISASLVGLAQAQNNINWVEFHQDDSLLSGSSSTLLNDNQEKDYAWGDLDGDGWIDLVIVRKQPYTTSGRYPNVLLMNEGGVLTDRTVQYASSSDVGGDSGFLTPTNDRDVIVTDVNLDGWNDVVTCTTVSPGTPKHISHPRVYINLGNDGSGNWQGLRFENARMPDFGTYPNFCGVGFGDVTGDGYPDLYFAHYHQSADVDLNDRLLINDGNGAFNDESSSRMTAAMLDSSFGVSAVIADMNGDGVADIVKDTALGSTGASGPKLAISYNNPANEGQFNILQEPYFGAPYHANVGDLNNDGKLDIVLADDGADRYLINQGNDVFGKVNWSAAYSFNTDDGFGSNNIMADLDMDGWNDILICDVDVDIPSCSRRLHIYHNRGGAVGDTVNMHEESGSGFIGVRGLNSSKMTGTHDVAIFDIDRDGDNDLVIGRCTGTDLWINDTFTGGPGPIGTNYCTAVINSTGQGGSTTGFGSLIAADDDLSLTASNLPNGQFGYFIASATQGLIVGPGGASGDLCLSGAMGRFIQQVQNSGSNGEFSIAVDTTALPAPLNTAILPGSTWNFVAWYRDVVLGTPTSNFTDGLSITFQ